MTILVTGATGNVGTELVAQLVRRGADVRAFVRDPAKAKMPAGVSLARGEMLDVDSVRSALKGVSTLFLLNAGVPDEFTQALIVLNLARDAGINRIVYFSVIHSDLYFDVPHFAAKFAVERMIEKTGLAATVLRPAYFINNDANVKDVIFRHGVYPAPVGEKGLAMVDVRDIGEIAAIELLKRERSPTPLPFERFNLVGPDLLTGSAVAQIWSKVLARQVVHAGNDTAAFEQTLRNFAPSWSAYDLRKMADRFQSDGMIPAAGDVERLTGIIGRPLRSYRDFAAELAARDSVL